MRRCAAVHYESRAGQIQDEAIRAISKTIRRSRSGLKDPHRPMGSFLFLGPSGVGKTLLSKALAPVMLAVGFSPDLLPLVIMRPLSGSGTLGVFTELVKNFGPDSLLARTAGTIFGSTETTFYVLAVYFGSVGIKRTRYAVLAGLTADLVGVVASVLICRLVFG